MTSEGKESTQVRRGTGHQGSGSAFGGGGGSLSPPPTLHMRLLASVTLRPGTRAGKTVPGAEQVRPCPPEARRREGHAGTTPSTREGAKSVPKAVGPQEKERMAF